MRYKFRDGLSARCLLGETPETSDSGDVSGDTSETTGEGAGQLLLQQLVPHGEEGDGQAGAEEDDEVGRQLEPTKRP